MKQQELNTFKRTYFDLSKPALLGHITHDPNTSVVHRIIVSAICEWATQHKLQFFTRVFLKEGKIVDIVIPDLPQPFVEIRHSELKKKKEYLDKYTSITQFVDSTDPFKLF